MAPPQLSMASPETSSMKSRSFPQKQCFRSPSPHLESGISPLGANDPTLFTRNWARRFGNIHILKIGDETAMHLIITVLVSSRLTPLSGLHFPFSRRDSRSPDRLKHYFRHARISSIASIRPASKLLHFVYQSQRPNRWYVVIEILHKLSK